MAKIKSKYKGYNFRSRIEARWAVFLDALELEWEYEKEPYDLGNGFNYLPDFFLPHVDHNDGKGCWLEIKGKTYETGRTPQLTSDEIEKAKRLSIQTQKSVYVMSRLYPFEIRGPLDNLTTEGSNWCFHTNGLSCDGGYGWGEKNHNIGIWYLPEIISQNVLKAFEKARGYQFYKK